MAKNQTDDPKVAGAPPARGRIVAYEVRTTGKPSTVHFRAAGIQFTPAPKIIPAERLNPHQLEKLKELPGVRIRVIEADDKGEPPQK